MDEALVKDAEDDIDDQNGDQQQNTQPLQRSLKSLSGALQAGVERRRDTQFLFERLDTRNRLTQRDAGQKVEGQGDCGQLPLMIDRQGLCLATDTGDGIEWDQLAA